MCSFIWPKLILLFGSRYPSSPLDHEMWPQHLNEETVWHRFDCWSYRLCPVTHVPWFSKPQWAHTNPRMSQVSIGLDAGLLPLANKPCFADFPPQKEWLDKLEFFEVHHDWIDITLTLYLLVCLHEIASSISAVGGKSSLTKSRP